MTEEQYELNWDDDDISLTEVISEFGKPPGGLSWTQILGEAQLCNWENIREDMKRASEKFPSALFKVEVMDYDTRERWMQYHRNGLHYQANEISYLPDFDEKLLKA